jgi:NADH dehydrogenase
MTSVVTGAFGFIGRYIARRLLDEGQRVLTITTHPHKPNPFGGWLQSFPYDFDQPDRLVDHLTGAETLYNTYWIRFPYRGITFGHAVANTKVLFECARQAGVRRIIHISVTNASTTSSLPYYAGKGLQEEALKACGVPYTIIRPTLVYGMEDILVNNIAWLLRKFPIFPVFGAGLYRLQPVFVEDLAKVAVNAASAPANQTIDAIGPDVYTFEEFVRLIAAKIKRRVIFLRVSPGLGIALGWLIGLTVGDRILTADELKGLMDEMLTSPQAPNGRTSFSTWLDANANRLGVGYASELGRHFIYKA